LLRKRVSFTI